MPLNAQPTSKSDSISSDVRYMPPSSREIEISLFGPGYGDSLVIHLGNGKWIIVDSCIHPELADPTPLAYLKEIGVDVAHDVLLVIASHWHDDHVRGLSDVFKACARAKLVCSLAMVKKEFVLLGDLYASRTIENLSGLKEFRRIHELLGEGRECKKTISGAQILPLTEGLPFPTKLYSLSPSDGAVEEFLKLATSLVPLDGTPRKAFLTPNNVAVVLQLIVDGESILLGSDLEDTKPHGWKMVVEDSTRPQEVSFLFKVAHHGSKTGHNDDVWLRMLEKNPYAVVSPFNRGKTIIPTPQDIERIKNFSNKAHITASPTRQKVKDYPPEVRRTLREGNARISKIIMTRGHVQVRFNPGEKASTKVAHFYGAYAL